MSARRKKLRAFSLAQEKALLAMYRKGSCPKAGTWRSLVRLGVINAPTFRHGPTFTPVGILVCEALFRRGAVQGQPLTAYSDKNGIVTGSLAVPRPPPPRSSETLGAALGGFVGALAGSVVAQGSITEARLEVRSKETQAPTSSTTKPAGAPS